VSTASDRTAFLRAIAADPEDDTPRLVFADWLDEHDDPQRAEFIRVQVELARRPPRRWCGGRRPAKAEPLGAGTAEPPAWCRCAWCRLSRRQADLARDHISVWAAEALEPVLARPRTDTPPAVRFYRGCAEFLQIATSDLMPHAGALFLVNPISEVVLIGHEPERLRGGFTWRSEGRWSPNYDWDGDGIPAALFKRLPGGTFPPGLSLVLRQYPTRVTALNALSAACADYGWEQADRLRARFAEPTEA
jgi:uncharacterized protein (TIGR02996 family)